ncbi:hypothetical protein FB45DRAFT_140547 [Roridomyces roridus]|uniref:Yeast cell wall synthesis Kre9/Knh1-like N-terminal domain-containing protein n=1 Tax=Roridomyces roridus TaxID=1738132 RepID=A0AAD7BHR5_9AGAR|nr:hypothetical protein FB45DRAFT_140547 [Roridomyces roridus]
MRQSIFLFLLALFTWNQLVFASLFPTYPVASTKCTAGQPIRVKWIDTRDKPHLREMGSLSIYLCTADGEPTTRLAERVSPMRREHTVYIPGNITTGVYSISFNSTYPPKTFWTHNFAIEQPVTDSTMPYAPAAEPEAGVTSNGNGNGPLLTIVLPTTTIVSQLGPTSELPPPATTITADDASPAAGGEAGQGLNRESSPNGGRKRRASRVRLVFVVWPALVGLSLAL